MKKSGLEKPRLNTSRKSTSASPSNLRTLKHSTTPCHGPLSRQPRASDGSGSSIPDLSTNDRNTRMDPSHSFPDPGIIVIDSESSHQAALPEGDSANGLYVFDVELYRPFKKYLMRPSWDWGQLRRFPLGCFQDSMGSALQGFHEEDV